MKRYDEIRNSKLTDTYIFRGEMQNLIGVVTGNVEAVKSNCMYLFGNWQIYIHWTVISTK